MGLAALALDGGHEGGLLAADEGASTQAQLQIEGEAGIEDVVAKQAVLLGLLDGDLQTLDGDGVFGADVDVALLSADAVAGDGHGLNDAVGVALQYGAVHEGAGVALVGVAADELHPVGGDGVVGELPLPARGEAGAAAATEAGGQNLVNDLLGRNFFGQDAAQGGVAVHADVLVNILGVDDAAVAQSDAQLVLVESGLGQAGGGAALVALHVEQPLDDTALDDVLGDNLGHVSRGDLGVAGALGVDHDDGAHGAQAEAAGLDYLGLLGHALGLQLTLKGLDDLQAVGGGAAGAGTDQDVGSNQIHAAYPPLFRRADGVLGHHLAVDQMVGHNSGHHLGLEFDIGDLLLTGDIHLGDGLQPAHADAAGLGDGDVLQLPLVDLLQEGLQDGPGAGGDAAGGHAHHHADGILIGLPQTHLLLHAVADGLQFFQAFHKFIPHSNKLTSARAGHTPPDCRRHGETPPRSCQRDGNIPRRDQTLCSSSSR